MVKEERVCTGGGGASGWRGGRACVGGSNVRREGRGVGPFFFFRNSLLSPTLPSFFHDPSVPAVRSHRG